MFEFNIIQVAGALQYLNDCCEWLATEDNIACLSEELCSEMVQQVIEKARCVLRGGYAVHDLMHPAGNCSSKTLGFKCLKGAEDARPVRLRLSIDIEKIQGTTTQVASGIRSMFSLYNKLLPVNRLPPELLGAVFEHMVDTAPLSPDSFESGEKSLQHAWPTVQAVCRQWRSVAIRTPALWSYMHICTRDYSSPRGEHQCENVVSTSLQRCGALPLTIALCSSHQPTSRRKNIFLTTALAQELAVIAPRIRELRLSTDVQRSILDLFTSEGCAVGLETVIVNRSSNVPADSIELFINWKAPRLRTLCVNASLGWMKASFSTLRRLILTQQAFPPDALQALHSLLRSNPCLEDLIIEDSGLADFLANEPFVVGLPVVDMPCLKRIAVTSHNPIRCSVGLLIEQKLLLRAGHAKSYSQFSSEALCRMFPPGGRQLFPVQRLFIGHDGHIIGTDGYSSFHFHTTNTIPRKFLQHCRTQCGQISVRELWLWSGLTLSDFMHDVIRAPGPRHWRMALETLTEVQKLVLLHDIPEWLNFISEHKFLPSLTELQLHIRHLRHPMRVLDFLEVRRRSGIPVDTLRFVLDSAEFDALQTFCFCEENTALFKQVVTRVEFAGLIDHPPRMELPDICLSESSMHSYWRAWDVEPAE